LVKDLEPGNAKTWRSAVARSGATHPGEFFTVFIRLPE